MEPAHLVHFEGVALESADVERSYARRGSRTSRASTVLSRALTIVVSQKTDRHVAWLANFHFVAAMAFLVKGVAAACLDFAPLVLPPDNIAQAGSCVLWGTLTLGCIFGAGPAVARLGPKRALLAGMALLDGFYLLFTVCALVGPGTAQWALFLAGMLLAGLGASLLLTAICVYMAKVAAVLAEESPMETLAEMTAHLGGTLGAWSLGTEVVFKLATAALRSLNLPYLVVLGLWTALAALCTGLFLFAREAPSVEEAGASADEGDAATAASEVRLFFSLWQDPKLWALGFTNFTFSFTDALLLNFINPQYVAPMLGDSAIGVMMALVSLVGAVLTKPYSFLGAYAGNGPVIFIAALSFAAVPTLVLFTGLCTSGGWWVMVLYICYGSGRAVVEGLNRAMFAEYFPGPLLDPAYANFNFQSSAVEAACNFAQTLASRGALLYTSVTLAALSTPLYYLAAHLRERELEQKGPGEEGSDVCGSTASSGSCNSTSRELPAVGQHEP